MDKADSLEAEQHKRADDDPLPSAGSQAMGRFRSAIICIRHYHYCSASEQTATRSLPKGPRPLSVVVVVVERGGSVAPLFGGGLQ